MDLTKFIKEKIEYIVKEKYGLDINSFVVEHPDNQEFGDFASNIAFVMSKQAKQLPINIAKNIAYELNNNSMIINDFGTDIKIFKKINIIEPGFINFTISDEWLKYLLRQVYSSEEYYKTNLTDLFLQKKVIVEYTDPNPFKIFHIGHVMTNTIGESIARLFEYVGADVVRANYQGDVGMHVGKTIWGLLKKMPAEKINTEDLEKRNLEERIRYLGECYAFGNIAFNENDESKKQIKDLNFYIYIAAQEYLIKEEKWEPKIDYKEYLDSFNKDLFNKVIKLYSLGRKWSLEYFETVYQRLGTNFNSYYFESKVSEFGLEIVKKYLDKGVFEKSEGAIIFRGEKYGLHTRVYVNSQGLPVYEAKDLGLAVMKNNDYKYDISYIVTANDINEYFKVILKSLEMIEPNLAKKTIHLGHGLMKIESGKMSSRTGEIIGGVDLLDIVKEHIKQIIVNQKVFKEKRINKKEIGEIADIISVGSVKYSILKKGIGEDIIYNEDEATSFTGNTGPYLQYTCVRANSVLEKADIDLNGRIDEINNCEITEEERAILRELYKFPEVVNKAVEENAPHIVSSYIFELGQRFNKFYANIPVVNAPTQELKIFRLMLTKCVLNNIKTGLYLLGIKVPEKM